MLFLSFFVDLIFRARSAYLQGERYMAWHLNPQDKATYYDDILATESKELRRLHEKGKLEKTEFDVRLELEKFRRDDAVAEEDS